MPRYMATKEGWDGRRIVKPGEVFNFSGPKGLWMVEVDENNRPVKGEKLPEEQRPLRAGAKQTTGQGRDALRARCKELGITFAATLGAVALAELIQKHEEELEKKNAPGASPENPDGGAPGLGTNGPAPTGNLEVL